MIKRLLQNKTVKNAGWLVAGRVIQMVINFLVGILTARYLGPGNYGLIGYAAAYTGFFTSFCTLGINSVIVKELIDNANENGKVIGTSLGLRTVSSVLSAITITCLSLILDAGEPTTQIVVALSSVSVIFHIFETFNYWFQSQLKSKKTAIASLIAYAITAAYKVVLLATSKSVEYFAIATSIDYLCIAIVLFYFYKRDNGQRLSFSLEYGKQLLKRSYHFILPGIMVSVYAQTDKLMLKHMIDETEIGYYATAVSLCNVWCFVLSAIIDSVVPSIMKAHKENEEEFDRLNRILYCIIFYVSAFVSLLFTIFGEFAISRLYGEAYMPAVAPLKIITWYTAFSYLGVAKNAWIVCENKQKYLKYIYISAAVSNVILNIIFIPMLQSTGAAIASLTAQIITTMVVPFFIKDMRKNSIMMLQAIFFKGLRGNK